MFVKSKYFSHDNPIKALAFILHTFNFVACHRQSMREILN
jgi:hypothetical protein